MGRILDRELKRQLRLQSHKPPFLPIVSAIPCLYAPYVDATRSRVAFGRRALPKLLKELHHPDKLLVRQALNSLSDLVYDPEKAYEAVKLNVIARVQDLLTSEDVYIRDRCCAILVTIADQAIGKEAIIKNDKALENILKLMGDEELGVRYKASLAFEITTSYWVVTDVSIKKWVLPIILHRLDVEEDPDVVKIHLRTLLSILQRGVNKEAVELGAMKILLKYIYYLRDEVRHYAIACLASLVSEHTGLELSIDTGLVLQLKERLFDHSVEVRSKTAACVSFIAVPPDPKIQVSELGITDELLSLAANHPNEELQINAVKVLTNIAETPKGRIYLSDKLQLIENITTGDSEKLERHIDTLVKVIKWKP
ncbi:radial spoke head 14 homolog [Schistocerca gregaria]|uniref:radial spoke head 14 homolog n=1 Tax=Schistocerca gregaria TaxID=7010 RepID=UPI00211EA115|nr:radial spoke head 14 homolog [Schistocerca gregaria]